MFQQKITSNKLKFNNKFKNYLLDIEKQTKFKIKSEQLKIIKNKIENNEYKKLSPELSKAHRKKFNNKRKEIIKEWEEQNSTDWKKYTEPIYSRKGKIVRETGNNYDAHHIIECSWGGDNQWWNMVPAKFPSEHQNGIHRKGGLAEDIFINGNTEDLKDTIRNRRNKRKFRN